MSRFGHAPLRRLWFAAGSALVLAACGDGNDSAPFSAEGTSNDMNAVSATFSSPAMASLGWAAGGIDVVFGAPMVSSSFGAIQDRCPGLTEPGCVGPPSGAFSDGVQRRVSEERGARRDSGRGARQDVRVQQRNGAVRGDERDRRAGQRRPVHPLRGEPDHATCRLSRSPRRATPTSWTRARRTANSVRLQLVSGGVTYLDYGVSGSATASTGHAVVDGFATDGTTRVELRPRQQLLRRRERNGGVRLQPRRLRRSRSRCTTSWA